MVLITDAARRFGLSRSTLLYYDRIDLLKPSERTGAGYRVYSPDDLERLSAICSFRRAGLTIEDIRHVLSVKEDAHGAIVRRRMDEIGKEILVLQAQQRLLGKMQKIQSCPALPNAIDKQAWVEMLRVAGMDEAAMKTWHLEFERRSPEGHHRFLLALGISKEEAESIRSAAGWEPRM
ncbi:MAG TPA: MerR family transcriptional regulator [Syntrophorhabdaceae bacterium]|jgi:DNA-binding transcriptional MerR regulator